MEIDIPDIYNLEHLGKSIESTQITMTFTYDSSMNHIEIKLNTITGERIEYDTNSTSAYQVNGTTYIRYKYTNTSPFYADMRHYSGAYIDNVISYTSFGKSYTGKKIYQIIYGDNLNLNLIDLEPTTVYFNNIKNIIFTHIMQMSVKLINFIFQSFQYHELRPIHIFSNDLIQPLWYVDLAKMTFIKIKAYQMKFRDYILKFKIYKCVYHKIIFVYLASIIIDGVNFNVITYENKKFKYKIDFCEDIFYTNEVIEFKKIIGESYKYGVSYSIDI